MDTSPSSLLVALLRKIATVVWGADKDGYAVNMSEWSRLTGQSLIQSERDGWLHAVHPSDRERVKAAWRSAFINQSEYNIDYRIRCADGAYRWFNSRGVPILGADLEVERWIGVILPLAAQRLHFPSERNSNRIKNQLPTSIAPEVCKAARAALGWSTQQLAQRAKVSASTIRRLESATEAKFTSQQKTQQIIETFISSDEIELLVGENGDVVGLVFHALQSS